MSAFIYRSREQRQVRRIVADLVRARELFLDLVTKDLRVRYRYAVLGFLWAVLEPLALMAVLTFIFTFVFPGRGPLEGGASQPLSVSLLCGLIFWQFTATSLNTAAQSLIYHQNLVKKVYFAREVIPLASTGYPLVNLGIGFVLLIALHLALGGAASPHLIWFVPVFAIHFALIVGLALIFSCANVHYRDIGYMVGVAVVFGFYASPIFYQLEFVTNPAAVPAWAEAWYPWFVRLYLANPMAELLTAYRQILFESRFPDLWLLGWPAVSAVLALAAGVVLFRRTGPTLSDYL